MSDTPIAPEGFKYMPCRICEIPMLVGIKRYRAPAHAECGVKAQLENMMQIAKKEGPYYERWRQGQLKYLETLRGGGVPPQGEG